MAIVLLVIGLILFVSLVVVHEFGHFIVARRNGVEVEEFGIGFPPRVWHKRLRTGFDFSLNLLPIGGFVRLKGEHDADTAPGSFGAANLWVKTKIMIAGVAMNLLAAFVLFTFLALIGLPKLIDNQFTVASDTKALQSRIIINDVVSGSPADKVGIQVNDQLEQIGLAGGTLHAVPDTSNLRSLTQQFAGQKVEIVYGHGGKTHTATTTLLSTQAVNDAEKQGKSVGYLGIDQVGYALERSSWSAPIVALGLIRQFTGLTFQGLGSFFVNIIHGHTAKATSQVTGPVGIFFLLKNGSVLGYQFVLMIIAVISLTLAIMNVLPIPALDGGRLFVLLLTNLFHKPLKQRTEEIIHATGFAVLMVLVVLITIVDVKRF